MFHYLIICLSLGTSLADKLKVSQTGYNIIHHHVHHPASSFYSHSILTGGDTNKINYISDNHFKQPSGASSYFGGQGGGGGGGYGYSHPPKNPFAQIFRPPAIFSKNPMPTCPAPIATCPHSPYRSYDGSCNNLINPLWGMANTRYGRLLSPKYGDGVSSPTVSVSGSDLPNARSVSVIVFGEDDVPDPDFTLHNMQWGQIMTHDMSRQAGGLQSTKHATRCCTDEGRLISKDRAHNTCFAIIIPRADPIYKATRRECMEFVRTLTDLDLNCPDVKHAAEQITEVTAFLDLSLVYGSSAEMNAQLRAPGGKMESDIRDGNEWLPQSTNSSQDCEVEDQNEICYLSGDIRVNQNPGLTILQTVLMREHNDLATRLAHFNPHWDDDRLFEEARKINIAQYSHINYYEWLPIFLGWDNMLKNRLIYRTHKGSFIKDYDPSIDPAVLNEHATAAFRYFHSQIEGRLDLVTELRTILGSLRLSDWFNRPGIIEVNDNYDSLVRGHATQPEELTDINFDREIKHFLFRANMPFGGDLRALDIQRNRDHGLASYNDVREFCGLKRAYTWEGFLDLISPKTVQDLQVLYEHPDDVDLTVGASLETHVPGALAGPTFLCILTEQFYRTRVGDRFFYENGNNGFSPAQLAEIRTKSSLARLLCKHGNNVQSMQRKAFITVSKDNPVIPCAHIPDIDVSLWLDDTFIKGPTHEPTYYAQFKK